jgi:FdhD protein
MSAPAPVSRVVLAGREGAGPDRRDLAEETPVAFTYNRETAAVMLATPADLADFALGFSLTEGIVRSPGEIEELETVVVEAGIELRMWLGAARQDALRARRRHLAGPSGCGLCGIDSLRAALRPLAAIAAEPRFAAADVTAAMAALTAGQVLNRQTRALHAAALWRPGEGIVALREDVGRHNALDKLAGALATAGTPASDGILLMSSRVSLELVQKAAMIGAPVLAAVSAPTALAVREAEAAGITLAAIVRADGFELFTHPRRIAGASLSGR